jgi:simple sugar transport system ATP-binding protein
MTQMEASERSSAPAAVEMRDITKRYAGTVALNGVSLAIRAGESHGLVGRNGAGKSTVVSVLMGQTRPDGGELLLAGRPVQNLMAREATSFPVACVYQHRTLVGDLSIAENLYLSELREQRIIRWKKLYADAQELLDSWEVPLSARSYVHDLPIDQAQLIEIIRALKHNARMIILDEPTAQLVASEIDRLMSRLNNLRKQGVTFLYISHHIREVFDVTDAVTVLRNGSKVWTKPTHSVSMSELVEAMVGDEVSVGDGARALQPGEAAGGSAAAGRRADPGAAPVVELRRVLAAGLTAPVDLEVRPYEMLGLAGHSDSGTRAIANVLSGLQQATSGEIWVGGTRRKHWRVPEAIDAGVSHVPEDRRAAGFVPDLSISENISLSILSRVARSGIVRRAAVDKIAALLCDSLDVVRASLRQHVSELSGGGQQKVVLGRALASQPRLLVLVHPTAGVDIASKASLFAAIEERRAQGLAVIVVSDEPEELMACERVQVFASGSLSREMAHWTENQLVASMEGYEV